MSHPLRTEDNSSSSAPRGSTNPVSVSSEDCDEWFDNNLECLICRFGRRESVQTPPGPTYCEGCILRSTRDAGPVHHEDLYRPESLFNYVASRSLEGRRPTMNEDLTWELGALNVDQAGSEQLQTEIERLRGLVNELQRSHEQKDREIDELRVSHEQKNREIDELRGSHEQKDREIDELRGLVNELRGSCQQDQTETINGLRNVNGLYNL
ncbi:uncharacterized protein [Acropora muricata]|uniref:uncharacterized protein n=1 Tax=Acropora muricata TaxID=159855 RepID=UPI0034E51338